VPVSETGTPTLIPRADQVHRQYCEAIFSRPLLDRSGPCPRRVLARRRHRGVV